MNSVVKNVIIKLRKNTKPKMLFFFGELKALIYKMTDLNISNTKNKHGILCWTKLPYKDHNSLVS